MASVWDLDAALLAKLQADATLAAFAVDGIWIGEAKTNALKFIQITRIQSTPEREFQDLAWVTVLYQVKAVHQNTSATDVKTAASRIDALLHDGTLTATNWKVMAMSMATQIRYNEPDKTNVDLRWQHGGGQYDVQAIPTA